MIVFRRRGERRNKANLRDKSDESAFRIAHVHSLSALLNVQLRSHRIAHCARYLALRSRACMPSMPLELAEAGMLQSSVRCEGKSRKALMLCDIGCKDQLNLCRSQARCDEGQAQSGTRSVKPMKVCRDLVLWEYLVLRQGTTYYGDLLHQLKTQRRS
nr:hypothetical protein CFP56_69530 [Quercus suber]